MNESLGVSDERLKDLLDDSDKAVAAELARLEAEAKIHKKQADTEPELETATDKNRQD